MSASKFLAGAIVGVVVGMMIAPETGEEFRANLGDRVDGLRKKLNRLSGNAMDKLDDLRSVLDNEIEGLTDDARKKIVKILDDAKAKTQNLSTEI